MVVKSTVRSAKRRRSDVHAQSQTVTDAPSGTVSAGDVSMRVKDAKPQHVRMPASLCPSPGGGFDLLELEDWIVGSFFVNYLRLWQSPPCVSDLMEVSGRSHKRVTDSLNRLVAKGWLGRAKVPHEFEPGRFGKRWRIWLTKASPLQLLKDARKGDGFRWVAVPSQVARYGSPLAVAVYMICHEQKRMDGAVTTTPSDIAALLDCDRTTAWRLLRVVGAKPVVEGRSGRTIYDLPLVYDAKAVSSATVGPYTVAVHGDAARCVGRWNLLIATLAAGGHEAALMAMLDELDERDVPMRMDLLIRVAEERFRRVLTKSPKYRARLALRFGWRLRAGLRRLPRADRKVVAAFEPEGRAELQTAVRDGLSHVCSTCDGMHLVSVRNPDDPRGGEVAAPCPVCT